MGGVCSRGGGAHQPRVIKHDVQGAHHVVQKPHHGDQPRRLSLLTSTFDGDTDDKGIQHPVIASGHTKKEVFYVDGNGNAHHSFREPLAMPGRKASFLSRQHSRDSDSGSRRGSPTSRKGSEGSVHSHSLEQRQAAGRRRKSSSNALSSQSLNQFVNETRHTGTHHHYHPAQQDGRRGSVPLIFGDESERDEERDWRAPPLFNPGRNHALQGTGSGASSRSRRHSVSHGADYGNGSPGSNRGSKSPGSALRSPGVALKSPGGILNKSPGHKSPGHHRSPEDKVVGRPPAVPFLGESDDYGKLRDQNPGNANASMDSSMNAGWPGVGTGRHAH
mmetsp:Transcript_42032/g.82233  ORF Transcript_42032/g.82233 Transcript_42032/m.82233 type:complete len:332 (+) Transcript_42032:144-1139(+)